MSKTRGILLVLFLSGLGASCGQLQSDLIGRGDGGDPGSAWKRTFLYVSNSGSDDLSIYEVDPVSGALRATDMSPLPSGGSTPYGLTAHEGRYLYVANQGSDTVSHFEIDSSTGGLQMVGTPVSSGSSPSYLEVSQTGRSLYVSNFGDQEVSRFALKSGGSLELGGSFSSGSQGIFQFVLHSAGFLYGGMFATGSEIARYSIQTDTEDLSLKTGFSAASFVLGMAIHPSENFVYASALGDQRIYGYRVDRLNGNLISVGAPVEAGSVPFALAPHPSGKFLYAMNYSGENLHRYTVDPITGQLQNPEVAASTGQNPFGYAFMPNGRFLYVVCLGEETVRTFSIDEESGALAEVGEAVPTGTAPIYAQIVEIEAK